MSDLTNYLIGDNADYMDYIFSWPILVNESKLKAIIIDIDDTLSNAGHRRKHIESEPRNWERFFQGMQYDPVNLHIKKVMDSYDSEIILLTGRIMQYKDITEKWLNDNDIKYSLLIMKPNEIKYINDFMFKEQVYKKQISRQYNVEYAIDDRQVVREMFEALNVKCYHPDYFENK